MMKCDQASRLVSEAQDRRLGFRERISLRLHLWMCGNCRRFERQVGLLRGALGLLSIRVDSASRGPKLSTEARERIHRKLAERNGHRH